VFSFAGETLESLGYFKFLLKSKTQACAPLFNGLYKHMFETILPNNLAHLVCRSCLSPPLHNSQNTRHGNFFQGTNRSTPSKTKCFENEFGHYVAANINAIVSNEPKKRHNPKELSKNFTLTPRYKKTIGFNDSCSCVRHWRDNLQGSSDTNGASNRNARNGKDSTVLPQSQTYEMNPAMWERLLSQRMLLHWRDNNALSLSV